MLLLRFPDENTKDTWLLFWSWFPLSHCTVVGYLLYRLRFPITVNEYRMDYLLHKVCCWRIICILHAFKINCSLNLWGCVQKYCYSGGSRQRCGSKEQESFNEGKQLQVQSTTLAALLRCCNPVKSLFKLSIRDILPWLKSCHIASGDEAIIQAPCRIRGC